MSLRPRKRASPIIPIVALVDILVIVLLFIVATTTFKQSDSEVRVQLPESKLIGQTSHANATSSTLTLTADRRFFIDENEYDSTSMQEAIQAQLNRNAQTQFKLHADKEAPVGLLLDLWNALQAANVAIDSVPVRVQKN